MRKKRKKKSRIVLLLFCIFISLNIGITAYLSYINYGKSLPNQAEADKKELVRDDFDVNTISSANVYMISRNSKGAILDKKGDQKIYPASMTKMMTILLGVENLNHLDQQISLSGDFSKFTIENASVAGFSPGETVTAKDLLYGAMLPSGADACMGIAMAVSGSVDSFVEKMNQKAQALGMRNTHFTNADGLHDPDHYSTAKDLALLLDYALEHKTFYKIFTAKTYQTRSNQIHPNGITLTSTLFHTADHTDFQNGKIIGGKTGYTEQAGLCLASLGVKHNQQYILVTAGAPGSNRTEPYHIEDALNIYGNYLK